MKKLLFLLFILLLIGNIYQVVRYQDQSHQLGLNLDKTLHKWLVGQRVNLSRISNLVTHILIIDDDVIRENYITNLDESVDIAISNMWSDSLITELTNWFERANYQHMLRQIKEYNMYILSDSNGLSEINHDTYQSIQETLEVMISSYDAIIEEIELIKDNSSKGLFKKTNWTKISNIKFDELLKHFSHNMRQLNSPEDVDYEYFMYLQKKQSQTQDEFLKNALINSDFELISIEQATQISEKFFQEIKALVSISSNNEDKRISSNIASEAQGRDESINMFGEVYHIKNSGDNTTYEASVSEKGGFILDFRITANTGLFSLDSIEKVINLVNDFNKLETEILSYDSPQTNHYTFFVKRDNILYMSNYVNIMLDSGKKTLTIDSRRPFYNINQKFEGYLRPEQALNMLSSYVKVKEEPRLVQINGKLLYLIHVEQFSNVNQVYLDAYSGEIFHIQ
jgi:hypothetical protein